MNHYEAIGKALCWLAEWAKAQPNGEVFVKRDEVCDGRLFVEAWRYDPESPVGYEQETCVELTGVEAPQVRAALEMVVSELQQKQEVSK